jgi:hypothetical protein
MVLCENIGELLRENITVLKSFAEYLTAGEIDAIEKLRSREGGIFRSGWKKIAACRDEAGRLHLHSAACTHGCIVHWNSWSNVGIAHATARISPPMARP